MVRRLRRIILTLGLLLLMLPVPCSAASDQTVFLDSIGTLSGSYIFMTYGYIGVVADAYSNNLYEAGQVKHMMEEKISFINKLVKALQNVQATNIDQTDRDVLDSMIEILGLLRTEAESLAAFAKSNDPADVERFDEVRQQAWSKIKKSFGIK